MLLIHKLSLQIRNLPNYKFKCISTIINVNIIVIGLTDLTVISTYICPFPSQFRKFVYNFILDTLEW